MKRIAVIDDNSAIRKALINMVQHNFPDQFEFEEASGVIEGFSLLKNKNFDIVLLDIEMNDGTGLELIESFREANFRLIFITGHKEYALNAIKLNAFDYILKPVNPLELIKVLTKALEKKKDDSKEIVTQQRILVKSHEATTIVEAQEIVRCEADGGYTSVYLSNGNRLLSSKNLRYFEERLDSTIFLRIHHAHLINSNFIKEISRHGNNGVVLKNDDKVPISVRKKSVINDFLMGFEK